MLNVQNISYTYDDKFHLDDISLKLKTGKILGIIGESGCGKTTLLKLIFGKLEPHQGELFWHNEKILGPSHQLIAGKEVFKYVTQDFELMPYISVLENIINPLSRQYMEDNIKRARHLLDVVNLQDFENNKVKHLSGGQQQRVALAKALAKTPKLLLLDEPFSHIDRFFKNELRRKLFNFIKDEKITCVLATHDKDDVLPFSDHVLVMRKGKTEDINTPINLYKNPKSSYVAGLFGDFNIIKSQDIWPAMQVNQDLIIYPHEIFIQESKHNTINILAQYFKGQFYTVVVEWKSKKLFIQTEKPLVLKNKYELVFKKDKIKQRYGFLNI